MARRTKNLNTILRGLDFITAILLLSGQVSINGIFLQTGGAFSVTISGPITGGHRIESRTGSELGNLAIDVINMLLAIFLLSGSISLLGTYFTSRRFNIVIGGPLFGGQRIEARGARRFAADFQKFVRSPHRKGR